MNRILLISALVLTACAEDGDRGPRGRTGSPGAGCTIESVSNGALVTCGTSNVVILHGEDGSDAPPTAFSVIGIIDLCGNGAEVLLRLANNQLLAHYSHGSKQYFAVLSPGQYISTDGLQCRFTVNADLSVSY